MWGEFLAITVINVGTAIVQVAAPIVITIIEIITK
jgi:hypothetical protein